MLAIIASTVLVFTNRVELLKLAVVLALWAAVAAAFVSFIYRRQSDLDQAKVRDLKYVYDLQLDREISARREYELAVEAQLRRELSAELRAQAADEVAALRAELAALRTNLEILFDTDLDHRPALETERPAGRVIASRIDTPVRAEGRAAHRGEPDHRRACRTASTPEYQWAPAEHVGPEPIAPDLFGGAHRRASEAEEPAPGNAAPPPPGPTQPPTPPPPRLHRPLLPRRPSGPGRRSMVAAPGRHLDSPAHAAGASARAGSASASGRRGLHREPSSPLRNRRTAVAVITAREAETAPPPRARLGTRCPAKPVRRHPRREPAGRPSRTVNRPRRPCSHPPPPPVQPPTPPPVPPPPQCRRTPARAAGERRWPARRWSTGLRAAVPPAGTHPPAVAGAVAARSELGSPRPCGTRIRDCNVYHD